MIAAPGTRIGTLRVAGGAEGLPTALRDADLRPAGLPADAVLVVRALADPSPGVVRGGTRPPRSWESAVAATLHARWLGAARPARGPVPAAADAVWFRDRAELLAALAADLLAGRIATAWWWRTLLRGGGDAPAAVAAAWSTHAVAGPSALGLLSAQHRAAAFARALPDARAAAVAVAVAAAWGGDPGPVPDPPARPGPPAAAPWSDRVPEAAVPDLTPGARLLLGVGLAAHRAPAAVASPAFWAAVRDWRDGRPPPPPPHPGAGLPSPDPGRPEAGSPDEPHPNGPRAPAGGADGHRSESVIRPEAPPSPSAAPSAPADPTAVPAPAVPPDRRQPDVTRATSDPDASAVFARRAGPLLAAPAGEPHLVASSRARDRPDAPPARTGTDAAPPAVWPGVGATPAAPSAAPDLAPWWPAPGDEPVDTALGGLFFLPGIALAHGWYGDFTRPRDPGIGLDPWRLVTLLGTALLTPAPLDSAPRPTTPHFCRMEPCGCFPAVDSSQLPPCGEGSGCGGPGEGAGVDPVWALLAGLTRDDAEPADAESTGPEPADPGRWRAWVAREAASVRAELARALGCPDEEAGGRLIRRHARVTASATRVDVRLALAELQIEIRLAGLDRDPGWLPAAGHVITLHFE